MSQAKTIRIKGRGVLCEVKGMHAGRMTLRVLVGSEKRSGKLVDYELEIEVERGSDFCVMEAFKQFAKREQMEATNMAHRWGVTNG